MNRDITLERRGGENKVVNADGKPVMVIVEGSDIDAMIDRGLEAIGGLKALIGDAGQVVLKPNTNQRDPYPSITAVDTIRAVARQCRQSGAAQIILHEDHRAELDLYYSPSDLPGVDIRISSSHDASQYVPVEYDKWTGDMDYDELMQLIEGQTLRGATRSLTDDFTRTTGPRIRLARVLQEAPFIINMPVLKRHMVGQITSALKNNFGSVYGAHRWIAHAVTANNRDYFDRKLAEFASAVRPELTIVDVRSLQAGWGPFISDKTKIVDGVNRVVITGDMVAANAKALELMKQYDDTFTSDMEAIVLKQQKYAEELGLGSGDLSELEIITIKS